MISSPIVVAIDGLAASGKGTLARRIAEKYGFAYLDSGKLYRFIAKELIQNNQTPTIENATAIAQKLSQNIPFEQLADPYLIKDEVSKLATIIAAFPDVRTALKKAQQEFATNPPANGAVIDGRDIGTVICPHAPVKLYIVADVEVRAQRRLKELGKNQASYEQTLADLQKRDSDDQNRAIAPLKKAQDAIEINTTNLTIEEALNECVEIIKRVIP